MLKFTSGIFGNAAKNECDKNVVLFAGSNSCAISSSCRNAANGGSSKCFI